MASSSKVETDLFRTALKNTHVINADYAHSRRALPGDSVSITGDDTDQMFLLVNGIQQYVTMNQCLVSVN